MSTLVDFNNISKEFAKQIYNNDGEFIRTQLSSAVSALNKETHQEFIDNLKDPHTEFHLMKLFKAITGYCGINNIDVNRFKVSI